jgi:large subunit ribosomal protein L2
MNKNNLLKYNLFNYTSKLLKIGTYFLGGRNFSGTICVQHRSGGNKHNYYLIDFFRRINLFGKIYKIIKDINRTAFLGAIIYENGLFSYIILSEGLKIGDEIYSGSLKSLDKEILNGYALPLKDYNLFTLVNNIEILPFSGASLARAAGVSCILSGKKKDKMIVKFKTG